ncbi:MAG TPA: hypothetical protein VI933_00450 [archaeon]|nr:hypothetical protein [archaeon]
MDQKKKQIIALFILVSFVFSGFAFAIISSLTGGGTTSGEEQPIYDQPLSGSDEQNLISRGKVIMKIYTSENCDSCGEAKSEVLKLFSKLGSNIVVENIDTKYFYSEIQSNSLEKFPTIIILGKGSDRIESAPTSAELLQKVCVQFTAKPAGCA